MEIKFTILTKDETGKEHNVGFEASEDSAKKLVNVLIKGINPNHIEDIVIHPEIVK